MKLAMKFALKVFFLPGDIVADFLGATQSDDRVMIRTLVDMLFWNAVVVIVALVIGGVEALGLIGNKLDLHGSFWTFIDALNENFGALGYLIILIFVVCWLVSTAIYRFKKFDEMQVTVVQRR